MTYSELRKVLSDAGVESPDFEAAELIRFFTGAGSASLRFGNYDSPALLEAVEKRLSGIPLQYVIGQWDFMGYTFKVGPECLIPRGDTELLCSYLIEKAPENGVFCDLCTGSGCIAVAALLDRPDLRAVAVELYPETLRLAKENAKMHGVTDRIEFIEGDVREDILTGQFDFIVSNPPYVTLEEMKEITREVSMEPPHALTDGGDGLSIIKKIIEHSPTHLKEGAPLAIEIGWKQGQDVCRIAEKHGLSSSVLHDIEGRDRVIVIKRKETV